LQEYGNDMKTKMIAIAPPRYTEIDLFPLM